MTPETEFILAEVLLWLALAAFLAGCVFFRLGWRFMREANRRLTESWRLRQEGLSIREKAYEVLAELERMSDAFRNGE